MKLSFCFIVLSLMMLQVLLANPIKAQKIEEFNITMELRNQSLRSAFKQIEKQSPYHFAYSPDLVSKYDNVTLEKENRSIEKTLTLLLQNTSLSFKQMDNTIMIFEKADKSANDNKKIEVVYNRYDEKLKGKVINENGEPLGGAAVKVKNTANGVIADSTGEFAIEAASDAILEVSSLGYQTIEIPVNGKTQIAVTLKAVASALDNVVVVGYGKQKKENLTGALSTVNADKDINWKPVGQVSVALQGTMPGVTVVQNSGQPGSDQGTIRIRGIGTLNDNDPLVLVDGVQMSINDIDANDIANVTVLKDAAAASIYGVRAANGVILVTTKRGTSKGKPRINYNNYFGWQNPTNMSEFLGAQDFMKLMNQTYTNSGGSPVYTDQAIAAYDDPNRNTDLYPDNDWANLILTGSGFQQQHSVSLAGGSENVKYRFSSNYFNQKGLISQMNFDRVTVRLNTDINVTEKISFSADLSTRLSTRTEPQDIGAGSSWFQFQSVNNSPLIVNQYSDGTWGSNIIRFQKEGGQYKYNNNLITGNFRGDYKIFKGLTLSGLASVNYTTDFNSLHTKQFVFYDFFTEPHAVLSTQGTNSITKQYAGNWFKNFQGLANYTGSFGSHSLHVLAGVSSLSRTNNEFTGYRTNIPNTDLEEINAGASDGQTTTGTADAYGLLSYFGRINYALSNKYLLEANVRHDGSSRFPDGERWGTFPSFSAGWRIGAENFMKNLNIFQELKLRASWGKLGNDNTSSNYPYQSTYSFSSSYPFGGVLNTAALLSAYPASSLSWETTKMWDIGLDITTLRNKLDITFDYYVKNTDDILIQLPIPLTTGLSAPFVNAGSVRNKGWEFSANYHDKVGKDFQYNIGFNIADVSNVITTMDGADYLSTRDDVTKAYYTGMPIGSFYGYEAIGLFQSQEDIDKSPTQSTGTAPGDIQFKDQNGDGVINDADRVNIGTSIPRYTYAINLSASYKGIDFSALFQGVGEQDIYVRNMQKAPTSNSGNFKAIHLDSWSEDNTDATFPRLSTGTQNYQSSSFWINNGTYLRLKSVQLGYRIPAAWIKKTGFSGLRFFASASNLFTITKLAKDIDPESPNDNRYYPQVRTITFGLNLDL